MTGDVAKVTIGMEGERHGTTLGASMSLISWAAFSSSDELAAINRDFAMRADEVRPVLMAFRKGGHPCRGPLVAHRFHQISDRSPTRAQDDLITSPFRQCGPLPEVYSVRRGGPFCVRDDTSSLAAKKGSVPSQ